MPVVPGDTGGVTDLSPVGLEPTTDFSAPNYTSQPLTDLKLLFRRNRTAETPPGRAEKTPTFWK